VRKSAVQREIFSLLRDAQHVRHFVYFACHFSRYASQLIFRYFHSRLRFGRLADAEATSPELLPRSISSTAFFSLKMLFAFRLRFRRLFAAVFIDAFPMPFATSD